MSPDAAPVAESVPSGWAWVDVVLENVRNTQGKEHPLFVLRALLKHAFGWQQRPLVEPPGWTFHPLEAVGHRVRKGRKYGVRVVLPPLPGAAAVELAAHVGENLAAWCGDGSLGRNFRVLGVPVVVPRCWGDVALEVDQCDQSDGPPEAEWALEWLTPLSLRAGTEGNWSGPRMADLLASRLTPLAMGSVATEALAAGLAVLRAGEIEVRPWFLERESWGHSQKHGPQRVASRETLAGLVGPLYLRGPVAALCQLRPALALAEEFHLGKGLHRGQGHCQLRLQRPYFDARLGGHTVYLDAFAAVREERAAESPVLPAEEPEMEPDALPLHALVDGEDYCQALAKEIREGAYEPAPSIKFTLPKKNGGTRTIQQLRDRDRVAQQTVQKVLAGVVDRQLEATSLAWRAGRGVETARKAVAQACREGLTWVVESDVAAFFDEMDHRVLAAAVQRMLPLADVATYQFLQACWQNLTETPESGRGVAQGSPLSPMLANIYLDRFDERLAALGHRLVRYGDDFLLLCPSREAAEQAMHHARAILAELQLELKEEKTALTSYHAGFYFLGREFGGGLDESAAEAATLRRTLFVSSPGAWVGQDHDSIVVRKGKSLLARVPLHRVSDVVLMGAQGVSTWLLQTCARRRIPVTLANSQGWHLQTLAPDSRQHWELAARQAARHQKLGPAGVLAQARRVVEAKLSNHLAWLADLPGGAAADAPRAHAAASLQAMLARLETARTVESLRGMEGQAASAVFPVVTGLVLDAAFASTRRLPREKADRWNALYDAASSLLFSRLNLLLRSRGINPYLGYLHSAADRYESLVCDLQEPFRARLDRFLLRTLNRRVLTPAHFTSQPGPPIRWKLTPEGYRRLLDAWDKELRLKLAGDPASLGYLLAGQAWLVCEYIQKHLPFLKFYRAATPLTPAELALATTYPADATEGSDPEPPDLELNHDPLP